MTDTVHGRVRNRQQALQLVAGHVAGLLGAGSIEEASGLIEHELTAAEARRVGWAMDEVARRLYAMGEPRRGRMGG